MSMLEMKIELQLRLGAVSLSLDKVSYQNCYCQILF